MMGFMATYLAVAGSTAAGAQVARGAIRGVTRLAKGDARGALIEVAGGLAAPVVTAAHQLTELGNEVGRSATTLTAELRERRKGREPSMTRIPVRHRRVPAPTAKGAA
jgi:hypothetical protein